MNFSEIYPNFNRCLYQTYDDAKLGREYLTSKIWNYVVWSEQKLKEINEKWWSICFSVNGFKTNKRTLENLSHINAWICECDSISKEFQKQLIMLCPIKPTLVIESKNSYHLYWYAKDATIENWKKICNWLCNFFYWDHQIVDFTRVLRLPWYYHKKDQSDPFLVEIVEYTGEYYTEEEMLKAYPDHRSNNDKKQELKKIEYEWSQDSIRHVVSKFDNMMMLQMLSKSEFMPDEITFHKNSDWTHQIYSNWISTWNRIDKNGMIWSRLWWWPTWVQWISWYWWIDWKSLYKRLMNKFPELEKMKQERKPQSIHEIKETKENDAMWFEYPSEVFEDFDCMTTWEYILVHSWTNVWKSTFVNAIAKKAANKTKVAYINLEFPIDKMLEIFFKRKIGCTDKNIVRKWTDLDPYTLEQKEWLRRYIEKSRETLDYIELPQWTPLEIVEEHIFKLYEQWYRMIVLDSLSSIDDFTENIQTQVKVAKRIHEIPKVIDIALIVIHHNNKDWKKLSWVQKIEDLANRRISIKKMISDWWWYYREFVLEKSKEHSETIKIPVAFYNWEYVKYHLIPDDDNEFDSDWDERF